VIVILPISPRKCRINRKSNRIQDIAGNIDQSLSAGTFM
jgi:hypothetical protein